jgi:hypothetical protein
MTYKIKTPLMAADVPQLLDLAFSGKTQDIVKHVIEHFTLDESNNPVDVTTLTVKEYMELLPQAMAALGFTESGNG